MCRSTWWGQTLNPTHILYNLICGGFQSAWIPRFGKLCANTYGPQTPGKQTEKIFHVHYLEQNKKEFSRKCLTHFPSDFALASVNDGGNSRALIGIKDSMNWSEQEGTKSIKMTKFNLKLQLHSCFCTCFSKWLKQREEMSRVKHFPQKWNLQSTLPQALHLKCKNVTIPHFRDIWV